MVKNTTGCCSALKVHSVTDAISFCFQNLMFLHLRLTASFHYEMATFVTYILYPIILYNTVTCMEQYDTQNCNQVKFWIEADFAHTCKIVS